MYQAGLVLEGGGMKGIYTAGVLDFFLDKGIEFSSCYGVSAGACHLCSYLSKQRGRAYDISVDYLDGGLSDSVPIMHSIVDGNRKNVVVLTKEVGYRREPSKHLELVRIRYAKYPKIYELMANRHTAYNRMLDYLEQQEKNGQAFVIRPQKKSGVGRVEKDKEKLRLLYEEGYKEAEQSYDRLMAYLEG